MILFSPGGESPKTSCISSLGIVWLCSELPSCLKVRSTAERRSAQDNPSAPTCRLIARKETGLIEVDTDTSLRGVPPAAWDYRLGTYSALEWVLERYKEKKPKDPTIAEKFNTYKFADYKESVIELLGKVCAVSVKTMEIVKEMPLCFFEYNFCSAPVAQWIE